MNKLHKDWAEKKLGEICNITSSKRIFESEYVESGIPFYRTKEIKELANGENVTTELFILEEKYNLIKINFGVPIEGDMLLTAIGTIGEIYIVEKEKDFYFKDGNVLWLKDFKSVNTYYLKFALRSLIAKIKALSTGSTYNALSIEKLKTYKILLPPLEEQERIAEILDRASSLISKRKDAIAKLDTLTQSIFIEMFGDPFTNPKGWAFAKLTDIAEKITDGEHQTPQRTLQGIKLLSARNIQNGYIDVRDVDYIGVEEYERIKKRCNPERGDILISCSGTIGRVTTVETDEPFSLVRSVAILKLKRNLIDSKFLEYFLRTPALNSKMKQRANASSQANLFQNQIRELPAMLPPLPLQKEFAQRIEAVEKLKATHRASLNELQALFASLQHRAFRGEL